jgi:predicted dehydrogenase
MTMGSIKIGIIGLGLWGRQAHLPAFSGLENVEIMALADPQRERAEEAAETFGVRRTEADPAALFRDPAGLDAVVIATPDDTHRDLALAAFGAGLHVLCEKPLAYDARQGKEMLEASQQTGRIGKIGFLYRHSPVVTRMKELIDQGFVGDVQIVQSVGGNAQFADPEAPLHWKMRRRHANGGVFVEYGSHTVDLALWFGGPIQSVVAHGITLIPSRPTPDGSGTVEWEDDASWIATYKRGGDALFRTGWASYPVDAGGTQVFGTKGTLGWRAGRDREALIAATPDQPEPHPIFEFVPPHDPTYDDGVHPIDLLGRYNERLAASFISDIRAGEASWPSFEDGLKAQRVLDAIRVSLDERRWVEVA